MKRNSRDDMREESFVSTGRLEERNRSDEERREKQLCSGTLTWMLYLQQKKEEEGEWVKTSPTNVD